MDITFYQKNGQTSLKGNHLEERPNHPSHQSKLVDYVGLTLKEYFAKTDQALSLKTPPKKEESTLLEKNEVEEGVYTQRLKD